MTTALLGLFTLLGISGCGAKQSNSQQTMNEDDGYTFVATLFCSTDGPNSSPAHYYLKNPDGTLYLDISITRKTTFRAIPYSMVRSSSTIGMG